MRTLTMLAVALAAAAAAPAANAVICYTLLDGSDQMVYQNSAPPVDMSDRGAAQRDTLRRNHEYLMVTEVDSCPPVAAGSGTASYRAATVDEIVAEMRGYLSYGGVSAVAGHTGTESGGGGGGGGGGGAAAPSGGGGGGGRGRY